MKNIKGIGVLSAVIGMILYKVMSNYYGANGPKLVSYVGVSISLVGLISLILMKHFLVAFLISMIVSPVVVMAIGMHFDNVLVVVGGIILLFIILPIVIKVSPYLSKNKK